MSRKSGPQAGSKAWLHPPSSLIDGHVVYAVKLLGAVEVGEAKGAAIVKEAITKSKFNRQIQKAEGTKAQKVELTISIDGVAIQDKQTKTKLHSYPLQNVSYCADDKQDKKICAFIAKNEKTKKHMCCVLDSEKFAEEITLTIGQAFGHAYNRYKQQMQRNPQFVHKINEYQQRFKKLESENQQLKSRVVDLESQLGLEPSYTLPKENGVEENKNSENAAPQTPGSTTSESEQTFKLEPFGGATSTDDGLLEFSNDPNDLFGPPLESINLPEGPGVNESSTNGFISQNGNASQLSTGASARPRPSNGVVNGMSKVGVTNKNNIVLAPPPRPQKRVRPGAPVSQLAEVSIQPSDQSVATSNQFDVSSAPSSGNPSQVEGALFQQTNDFDDLFGSGGDFSTSMKTTPSALDEFDPLGA